MSLPLPPTWNFAALVLGPKQYGKSTILRQLVRDHLAAGGRALIHDPNRQFRDLAAVYDSVAAYRAAAEASVAKREDFPRGASIGGKAEEVTRLALELGRAHNTADNIRVPIMLGYDESSLLGTSGSSWMGAIDNELLCNARHLGVGPIYNAQRPTALTEAFYELATDVWIFSQKSQRRTRIIEEYLGLPDDALLDMVGAPPFKFRHWQAGKGLV